VDRIVGMGLVRPRTERPVSGVCARSRSRPVPPSRRFLGPRLDARFFVPVRDDEAVRVAGLDRAVPLFLPFGVFAAVVLRPVFRRAAEARRAPAPLRAAALPPDPARLFGGVRFCPFLEPLLEDPAAFRFAVFLAIVFFDPSSGDPAADSVH
jgi:hypothetical protein